MCALLPERVQGRRPRPHMQSWMSLSPPLGQGEMRSRWGPRTLAAPWMLAQTLCPGDIWTGDDAKAPSNAYCSQWALPHQKLFRAAWHGQNPISHWSTRQYWLESSYCSSVSYPTGFSSSHKHAILTTLHLSLQICWKWCINLQKQLSDWQRLELSDHSSGSMWSPCRGNWVLHASLSHC